ncbi:MAG TPA: glycosyl hydrolase [Acidobacteriota bacterium]|nr:glycosyl hydrolase [Acidobacteriota bacterium]
MTVLLLGLLLDPGRAANPAGLSSPDVDSQALESLHFRAIGPAVQGGRVTSLAVVEGQPSIFYVGTASGNLWKTENFGTTFEPLFEDQATASVGAVALAPSDPNVIWLGTGEANNRQSSPWGEGVYRSTDGGRTWSHLGLAETRHIGRILVHPFRSSTAWVAALGHLWGPNPERGLYRTRDGGLSWQKVLDLGPDTGVVDLAMHPSRPHIIYAAAYQRRRTAFGFAGGGEGSAIYRSLDGGDNWQRLSQGLPNSPMGRIGLAVAASDPDRLYAIVEASGGGLFLSRDRGGTFTRVNDRNPRPMYFSKLGVDPSDADHLWLLGVHLHESRDGGNTLSNNAAAQVHPDHHAIWISRDGSRLLLGGDGGLSASFDGGKSWRMFDNLPISQFYKIGVDMDHPYRIYGGLQDNGTWAVPSAVSDARGIRNADWINLNGGDGFYAQADPLQPGVVYVESQRGRLLRVDLSNGSRQLIQPTPAPGDSPYRWNWNAPLLLSRHNPDTLYSGANVLLRSGDRGYSWQAISPDLTYAVDRSRLEISGDRPFTLLSRHDGVAFYGTLTALAESPLDPQVLYTGSDDGRLHVSRDGGGSWQDIGSNIAGLPERALVSSIAASAAQPGRVYAAFDNHRNDDYRPLLYASQDFGASWEMVVEGLPETSINVVLEDPVNPELLYLGNERGLYLSFDRGQAWRRLKANLPTVPLDDIVVHPRENDLILATHGRGLWILDDAKPLQEWTRRNSDSLHLFTPRAAQIHHLRKPQSWTGDGDFAAPNRPYGALIRYYLPQAVEQPQLQVLAEDGVPVRALPAPEQAGLHQVLWDLRGEAPAIAPPRRKPRGPQVAPGIYSVRLRAGEETMERTFAVRLDPSLSIPAEDLRERRETVEHLQELLHSLNLSLQAARRLDDALEGLRAAPGEDTDLRRLRRSLARSARSLGELRRSLPVLLATVDATFLPPTDQQLRGARRARQVLLEAVRNLEALRRHEVPQLYQRAGQPLPDLGGDWPLINSVLETQEGNK